jgi:hypothetical protein
LLARARLALPEIRKIRAELMLTVDVASDTPSKAAEIGALYHYERI